MYVQWRRATCVFALIAGCLVVLPVFAAQQAHTDSNPKQIPSIQQKNGHFALMVDGKPYLMLGVQANN